MTKINGSDAAGAAGDSGQNDSNGAGQAPKDGSVTPEAAAPVAGHLPPEATAQIAKLREHVQLSVGQMALSMMSLPRYRYLTLSDLQPFVLNPLLRNRLAVAHRRTGTDAQGEDIAGFILWATVSPEVDAKLSEQVKNGVFPVRLNAEDWASGDIVWLFDLIAADAQHATNLLQNFGQLAEGRPVKIHPAIGRLIEPEALAKLQKAQVPAGVDAQDSDAK